MKNGSATGSQGRMKHSAHNKETKATRIGYILRRSYLPKHGIEGKIEGEGRRGRRRKQMLDDIKETRI
jgi:hypothetical protein